MVIDWMFVTFFVIILFTASGFARGWWKEALTTICLVWFIFLLQRPEIAQMLISSLNNITGAFWSFIPTSVSPVQMSGGQTVVTITTNSQPNPFLLNANSSNTWLNLLMVTIAGTILFGRYVLDKKYQPNPMGQLFGAGLGFLNGFFAVGLAREYLDGRALPGNAVASSQIVLSGSNGLGAQGTLFQAMGLPNFTILDSIFPWMVIIPGLLLLLVLLKARVGLEKSEDGMKLTMKKRPEFYTEPSPGKNPKTLEEIIERVYTGPKPPGKKSFYDKLVALFGF